MIFGRLTLTAICVLFFARSAHAAPPDPRQLLAETGAASGGGRWEAVRNLHGVYRVETGGLTGKVEVWQDVLGGRWHEGFQLGPDSGADGFDGKVPWAEDSSGQARPETTAEELEDTVSKAYRTKLAYWFPARHAAAIEYAGRKRGRGTPFHLVRITPTAGRPFEFWINTRTKLIERMIEKEDNQTRTEIYSDYRVIGGLRVPFATRVRVGESKYDQHLKLETLEIDAELDEAKFSLPPPPKPDFAFPSGKTEISVPFRIANGHIYLDVKVNGRGAPVRVIFDSGGTNLLLPTAARRLQLSPEGALRVRGAGQKSQDAGLVKVRELDVGGIVLRDQVFETVDLETFMRRIEGLDDVGGMLGYELLKRFPTKIDYQASILTFYPPENFKYAGSGVRVPFRFSGHHPLVEGSIDGLMGIFDIDTGSGSSLGLMKPFVDKHGLLARYGAKQLVVSGAGVGGWVRSFLARGDSLRLGDVSVAGPLINLSQLSKGYFSNGDVSGNVGYGILHRFAITFDYARQELFFEKNASYAEADVADRAGLWLERTSRGFEVFEVVAGSPAAEAGMRAGDIIVAVDDKLTTAVTLADTRQHLKATPGTKVRLQLGGKRQRAVTLTLRDLI